MPKRFQIPSDAIRVAMASATYPIRRVRDATTEKSVRSPALLLLDELSVNGVEQDFFVDDRLGDVLVESCLHESFTVDRRGVRGQRDDAQMLHAVVTPNVAEHFDAIHLG